MHCGQQLLGVLVLSCCLIFRLGDATGGFSCCSAGGTDCAACVPQAHRTSNCHCETCNPGYHNPTASGCQPCLDLSGTYSQSPTFQASGLVTVIGGRCSGNISNMWWSGAYDQIGINQLRIRSSAVIGTVTTVRGAYSVSWSDNNVWSQVDVPCSNDWGECSSSRCCQNLPDWKCFVEHVWYAQCRQSCPSGWSCTVLAIQGIQFDAVLLEQSCRPANGAGNPNSPTSTCVISGVTSRGDCLRMCQNGTQGHGCSFPDAEISGCEWNRTSGCQLFRLPLATPGTALHDHACWLRTTTMTATTTTTPTMTTISTTITTTTTPTMTTISTTIAATTTSLSSAAAMVIDGNLVLNVSNARQFVREPNAETAMQVAIANLSCVNITWVVGVTVTLVSYHRRLGVLPLGTGDDTNERLLNSYSTTVGTVQVDFQIDFPPGGGSVVLVTATMGSINSMELSHASLVIDRILKSGVLGQPYDATVIRMVSTSPQLVPAPAPSPPQADSRSIALIIIIIGCVFGFLFICWAAALWMMRNQLACPAWFRNIVQEHSSHEQDDVTSKVSILHGEPVGSWDSYTLDMLLFPPETISSLDGERLRRVVRATIDRDQHNAPVFLTYAMGQRSCDAVGVGPGMYYAAALTKILYENKVECFSDLALPTGADPDVFSASISLEKSIKVLIVLQTKALYACPRALKQIYTAQKKHVAIYPLRFGNDLPAKADEWPHVRSNDLDSVLMLSEVQAGFGRMNCIPSPPYTVMQQTQVLRDVVTDIMFHTTKKGRAVVLLKDPTCETTGVSTRTSQESHVHFSEEDAVVRRPSSGSLSIKSEPAPKSIGRQPSRARDDQNIDTCKGTSKPRSASHSPPPAAVIGRPLQDRPKNKEERTSETRNARRLELRQCATKKHNTSSIGTMLSPRQPTAKTHLDLTGVATTSKGMTSDGEKPLTNEPKKSPRPSRESATSKKQPTSHKETRNRDGKPSIASNNRRSKSSPPNNRGGRHADITSKRAKDGSRSKPKPFPHDANDSPNETATPQRKSGTRKKGNRYNTVCMLPHDANDSPNETATPRRKSGTRKKGKRYNTVSNDKNSRISAMNESST